MFLLPAKPIPTLYRHAFPRSQVPLVDFQEKKIVTALPINKRNLQVEAKTLLG